MDEFTWSGVDFAALYGLSERELGAARQSHHTHGLLRIPIGIDSTGNPAALQIPLDAETNAHGIVVGASGSGKSELLRTAVVGAAIACSPEDIGFFLVDFRGDGTFDDLADLPHVSGLVSGVAQDLSLADRIANALIRELARREEKYRSAGRLANTAEYQRARQADAEPLPRLVVVIDALDELLAQRPQFADAVNTMGRVGRTHGFSLLVSAQQLTENPFRGVDNHFTCRIALGNLSAEESQRVLGTDDAPMLPDAPGHGYLRDGHLEPIRFTAARPTRLRRSHDAHPNDADDRAKLDIIVSQIHSHDQRVRAIWLPPLDPASTLDQLIDMTSTGDNRRVSTLRVPIGIVERPELQRRDPLIVDLSGPQGNVGIHGADPSTKSTALQSLIMALALTHTAEQVQFYCLCIGPELARLEQLPHVGSVATLYDEGPVRRMLNQLTALVQHRERYFRETGIESMDQFRRLRTMDSGDNPAASAAIRDDPFGDVFLVTDGLRQLRNDRETEFYKAIVGLGARGPAYGVHVLTVMSYWSDADPPLDEALGTRFGLRMPGPRYRSDDSEIARQVPQDPPGSGLTLADREICIALPRLDGDTDPETLHNATTLAIAKIRADTPGHPAPAIRQLPERVDRDELLRRAGNWPSGVDSDEICLRFPIGIDETHHAPVYLDFEATPHLIIIGEPGCGKTTVLRSIIAAICASNTVEQARFVLVDYRATGLVDSIPEKFLAGYSEGVQTAGDLLGELAQYLKRRMPGPQESTPQAPERWWPGPDIFVVIDDHQLAPDTHDNPARRLMAQLSFARQVGLHLIIARSSVGADRGMAEPTLGELRHLSTTTLIMSSDPSEGRLPRLRFEKLPPGRGILHTRSGYEYEYIQTAWNSPI
ncbi:type VII secretion protein EccCb [Nocardia sp. CA2R105]|uniref:type VII secretion protein EccCb n=1 Tax=Nocardia coffeae TaxID=2873381 RepID=UPI001CA66CF1|nr:type VII secretion protein EccCb [Nocardia coffeae]MBY8862165.1 type VII secretion protein EccCb [Nocardia coffeae]